MRVLLTEDERSLSRAVIAILRHNGYEADAAYDGVQALEMLADGSYDALVLDIMMPKMDGIEVLRRLRADGNRIPVIMLSAKSDVETKVDGLDSGANDYLTKPFETQELLARIRAITRDIAHVDVTVAHIGNFSYDRASRKVWTDAASLYLSEQEGMLLDALMQANGHSIQSHRIAELLELDVRDGDESNIAVNVAAFASFLNKKMRYLGASHGVVGSFDDGYSITEGELVKTTIPCSNCVDESAHAVDVSLNVDTSSCQTNAVTAATIPETGSATSSAASDEASGDSTPSKQTFGDDEETKPPAAVAVVNGTNASGKQATKNVAIASDKRNDDVSPVDEGKKEKEDTKKPSKPDKKQRQQKRQKSTLNIPFIGGRKQKEQKQREISRRSEPEYHRTSRR